MLTGHFKWLRADDEDATANFTQNSLSDFKAADEVCLSDEQS